MKKKKLSKKNSAGKKRITRLKKNKADSSASKFSRIVKFLANLLLSMVLKAIFEKPIKESLSWLGQLVKEVISWL
jgi:hypothetical protein